MLTLVTVKRPRPTSIGRGLTDIQFIQIAAASKPLR